MLVNLTPNQEESERRKSVAMEHNFDWIPQYDPRLQEFGIGIYQANVPHNFSHEEFMEFRENHNIPYDLSYEAIAGKEQFGVADSINQIKEYFKEQIEDPIRKFFIDFTPVYQDRVNKGNGWRWHKWGPYIGELNPQYEYLDDEDFGPNFEYVICFHIHEVK